MRGVSMTQKWLVDRSFIQGDMECGEEMDFERPLKNSVLNILRLRWLWDIYEIVSTKQEVFEISYPKY